MPVDGGSYAISARATGYKAVTITRQLDFEGSIMAQTVTFHDSCSAYCDEALTAAPTVSLVK